MSGAGARLNLPLALMRLLPPEIAHRAALRGAGLYPSPAGAPDPRLAVEAFGLKFPNPLGLAAGFDKNAESADALLRLGFGFVEVGTLTPRPQAGNPKPRLFRLEADRAVVNRMGFNNDGYARAVARLTRRKGLGLVGVNIGPNKDSPDRVADYVAGIAAFAAFADYFTVNVSSPNTPGLRDLQARDEFAALLDRVLAARERAASRRPVLVKLSPDLTSQDLEDAVATAAERGVDGLIVSNTTISRPLALTSAAARETGGLSGRPLFDLSTRRLAQAYQLSGGRLPLVGVGGVDDAGAALAKIEAGASLVQLYTGFVYRGPALVGEILDGFAAELSRRNVASLGALVGTRASALAAD